MKKVQWWHEGYIWFISPYYHVDYAQEWRREILQAHCKIKVLILKAGLDDLRVLKNNPFQIKGKDELPSIMLV